MAGACALIALLTAFMPHRAVPASPRALPGWSLYDRYCLPCHGSAGDGRGPAAAFTRSVPRDLRRGELAWGDLRTTIRYGAPGTSMPAFPLAETEIDQLVAVVQAFAPSGTPAAAVAPAPLGPSDAARGAALWHEQGCAACHGSAGRGDTPAARALSVWPADLTTEPLHRPRAPGVSVAASAFATISAGLPGTPMPGYASAIAESDRWALAHHVAALNRDARLTAPMSPRTIARDRAQPMTVGTWPGADPDEAKLFGGVIAPQGPPPATLAPAQASLAARQCGRCHAKQYREWQPSLHHGASSPGLAAQMYALKPAAVAACLRCHAPLAEQQPDRGRRDDGTSCAGCHVRTWERHGPPGVAPSLLASATYPFTELPLYERADFCLPCHQLPARTAVAGKPLLDTYREWLEGPYMPRGIQCQHCHMPNREHTFLGIHDRETFRQGIALTATATRTGTTIEARATLANVGAGHYLPTTPTPAVWLTIELLDDEGVAIAGARTTKRIGRDIYSDGQWHEREDTRIPPGGSRVLAWRWWSGRTAEAVVARVTVEVRPDDYYERLYETRLRGTLPAPRRVLYEQALARARANHYLAESRDVPIAP